MKRLSWKTELISNPRSKSKDVGKPLARGEVVPEMTCHSPPPADLSSSFSFSGRRLSRHWLSALILACMLVGISISGSWGEEPSANADKGELQEPLPPPVLNDARNWPLFRGDSQARGIAQTELPENLDLLWQYEVPRGAFDGTPIIVEGVVYIGDLDGVLHALDMKDGTKRWEFKNDIGFTAAPAVRDDRVYIGDIDGHFHCIDAKSGERLWHHEAGAEVDSGANFFGDKVLFGSQDSVLYCLMADSGELVWKHSINDQIRCSPTIVEDRIFLAGCDGLLHILNARTGEPLRDVEIESPTGVTPAASGDYVYFGTEAGVFFCIDWKKGEVVWKFQDGERSQAFRSSPTVHDELVIFGGRNRRLHALDKQTGQERWSHVSRGRIDSSPITVGDRVFFGSSDGRLTALKVADGSPAWEFEVRGSFNGSAAAAEERLFIASSNGVVYCFGAAP